jgi:hypothetical protein
MCKTKGRICCMWISIILMLILIRIWIGINIRIRIRIRIGTKTMLIYNTASDCAPDPIHIVTPESGIQLEEFLTSKIAFCFFFTFFWRAKMCWPLLCLCRPFCIFRDVWIRTQRATVASSNNANAVQ